MQFEPRFKSYFHVTKLPCATMVRTSRLRKLIWWRCVMCCVTMDSMRYFLLAGRLFLFLSVLMILNAGKTWAHDGMRHYPDSAKTQITSSHSDHRSDKSLPEESLKTQDSRFVSASEVHPLTVRVCGNSCCSGSGTCCPSSAAGAPQTTTVAFPVKDGKKFAFVATQGEAPRAPPSSLFRPPRFTV